MRSLKPGERVRLIKKLASRLAELDSDEVNMMLRQFGLPWDKPWDWARPYAYALAQLERGEDAGLLALDEYFSPEGGSPDSSSTPSDAGWQPGLFRLFMSHVSADKTLVSEVKAHLAKCAVEAFVAHEDIEPTAEWVPEIERKLDTCHALAAFLTTGFHASKWTDQEIGYCVKRRVLIIPIRLGVDPYGFIARYQGFNGRNRTPDEIAAGIVEILVGRDLTAAQMAEALVAHFERSESFEEAKRNVKLLQQVKKWTPGLLRRLEAAVEENNQIGDAWGVPEKIRALVEEHAT